jgi:voltage-dependent calcium channel
LTFFEVSTLEGWVETMYIAVDSADKVDQARKFGNRPFMQLIYIVFIFISTFFVMNLFISVIVNKFQEEKEKTEGTAGLSDDQKEWVKI